MTTSHFNDATPFDGAVFGLMGFMILFSSVLAGVLLFKEDRFMQVLGARRHEHDMNSAIPKAGVP